MSAFNEHHFEKKLSLLKDSQESIQLLSTWCLAHRQHHKGIVNCWLKVLKKVKLEHRLTLFYLANDVIQYSKRKNYEYVESWGTALQRATTMVRDDKVKEKILRIFRIWGERGVYDDSFVADLCGLMSLPSKKRPVEPEQPDVPDLPDPLDFHPPALFDRVRSCHKLEDDTDLKLTRLNETHQQLTDADALRRHLKDKRQGDDAVAEVEEGVRKMGAYMKALEAEIEERKKLIVELDQAEKYYEAQKGEAKLVVNAYKNFGGRVKNLKRHLDERLPSFACPSPIPSPDINAPSPSPDCDIELPEDPDLLVPMPMPESGIMDDFSFIPGLSGDMSHAAQDQSLENCFASFLGSGSLPFDFQKTLFSESSGDPGNSSEGKPIEVINSRNEMDSMESSLSNFLKSLGSLGSNSPLPTSSPASAAPFSTHPAAPDPSVIQDYDYPVDSTPPAPVPPPPLPPNIFNILPPKFPTWGGGDDGGWEEADEWLASKEHDTPESPPVCDKEGFGDAPVVYDDSAPPPPAPPSMVDVDQRRLHIPLPSQATADVDHRVHLPRKIDVDHRNLISLTGSPGQDPPCPPGRGWADRDYRSVGGSRQSVHPSSVEGIDVDYRIPPPPPPALASADETRDNVESVDMDMSDEELSENNASLESPAKKERLAGEKELQNSLKRSDQSPITFNINPGGSKMLKVSPLNESNDESNKRHHPFGPRMPLGGAVSNHDSPRREHFAPPGVRPPPPHLSGVRPLTHAGAMPNSRPPFRPSRPPGPPPGPPPGHPRMMNRHVRPPNMNQSPPNMNPPPSHSSNVNPSPSRPPPMDQQPPHPHNMNLPLSHPPNMNQPNMNQQPSHPPHMNPPNMNLSLPHPPNMNQPNMNQQPSHPPHMNPPNMNPSPSRPPNMNQQPSHPPNMNPPNMNPSPSRPPNMNQQPSHPPNMNPPNMNPSPSRPPNMNQQPSRPPNMNAPPLRPPNMNPTQLRPPHMNATQLRPPNMNLPQSSAPPDMMPHSRPPLISTPPSCVKTTPPPLLNTPPSVMKPIAGLMDSLVEIPESLVCDKLVEKVPIAAVDPNPPPAGNGNGLDSSRPGEEVSPWTPSRPDMVDVNGRAKMPEPPPWIDRGNERWDEDEHEDVNKFVRFNEWDDRPQDNFDRFAHEHRGGGGGGFNPRSRPNGRGGGPRRGGGGQNRRMFGGHGAPRRPGRGSFGGHQGNYGGW